MKRLFWLFTLLICFSFVGFSKTTTDLAENSKQDKEFVSYTDVVNVDVAIVASANSKAVLSTVSVSEVPRSFTEANIYTANLITPKSISQKPDVLVCIRDKIRR